MSEFTSDHEAWVCGAAGAALAPTGVPLRLPARTPRTLPGEAMTHDRLGQPILRADLPRVRVTVTAATYAELAPRAVAAATPVLPAEGGPYAAAIVGEGPWVRIKQMVSGDVYSTQGDFEVGTEADR